MAATGLKTIYIDLQTSADPTIVIATDALFTENVEHIVKSNIRNFKAVYNPAPGSAYPYPTQTMANVHLHDDGIWSFELQNVDATAHPTWVTGDQAACTAFQTDLTASLP